MKNHLVMSDTAQRRDLSDPNTVRDFVATVQSPEMLRLLLVLTVADIRAVGPGVWNGWKGQLLRELYYAAEHMMTGGDAAPARAARVGDAKEALARISDFTPDAARTRPVAPLRQLLAGLQRCDEQERHRPSDQRKADAEGDLLVLAADTSKFRAVTELMIYTPDHPGLFSKLSGAIAISGGSIVDAKAFTTTDGFALDVFSLQDADGGAFGDPPRIERLRQAIAKTPCRANSGRAGRWRQAAAAQEARGRIQRSPARGVRQ